MRFDWYSGTPRDRPERVLDALVSLLSSSVEGFEITRHPGTQGYEFEDRMIDGLGTRVFGLLHGGHNSVPHVRSSGIYSPLAASALRQAYPDHTVSRADVAIDFCGPSAWNILRQSCELVATGRNLKWAVLGDDRPEGVRDPSQGRTLYVGSRQSPVFIRCYEKGLHEASKGISYGPDGLPPSPDWVRVECEVKPPNRLAKARAARLSPEQFWGCSPGSRAILSRILSVDVERITMTEHRKPDYERALLHAAVQYRSACEKLIDANGGDPSSLIRFFQTVWVQMDEHRQSA